MSYNKPIGCSSTLNFIQTDAGICEKIRAEVFAFSSVVTLSESKRQSKWHQGIQFSGICHRIKFERSRGLQMSKRKQALSSSIYSPIYFSRNRLSRIRSLESRLDEIKRAQGSSDQQIYTACFIPTKSIEGFIIIVQDSSFCFLMSIWPWIKVRAI